MWKKITAVLIIVLFISRAMSYQLIMWTNGFSVTEDEIIHYSYQEFDNSKGPMKVIKTKDKDDHLVLVRLLKSKYGFWSIQESKVAESSDEILLIVWTDRAKLKSFTTSYHDSGNTDVEWMYHHVYTGENAVKKIDIPNDVIPKNSVISISQSNENYVIHRIMNSQGGLIEFDLIDYLREYEYIE